MQTFRGIFFFHLLLTSVFEREITLINFIPSSCMCVHVGWVQFWHDVPVSRVQVKSSSSSPVDDRTNERRAGMIHTSSKMAVCWSPTISLPDFACYNFRGFLLNFSRCFQILDRLDGHIRLSKQITMKYNLWMYMNWLQSKLKVIIFHQWSTFIEHNYVLV